MLPEAVLRAIAEVASESSGGLSSVIREGRSQEEPDMTSRLAQYIELLSAREVEGVRVEMTVVSSLGGQSQEQTIGADLVGVFRIEVGTTRVTKGFLVQSKRSGHQGLHFEASGSATSNDYSHWLYRGALELEPSGTVMVTRPSEDLQEQCERMLSRTPASFVFVYDSAQVAVVGASAVLAKRNRPRNTKKREPLGTKQLDDFFVHVADSFIGDPNIAAATPQSLQALVSREQANSGLLLSVTDMAAAQVRQTTQSPQS